MEPAATRWSDGETGGRKTRRCLGLVLAAVAVLVLGWVARGIIPPWSHPEPTLASEVAVPGESLAGIGRPAMHIQSVDRGVEARPYLGITYVPVNPRVASRYGLGVDWGILITAVSGGGPADRAGVSAGDIVLFLDDQAISPDVSFLDLLWHHRPGATVKLVVWREGRHFTTEAVLGTQ